MDGDRPALVVVSGVSGVGKTSLCASLKATVVSLDDFYRTPTDDLPRWGGEIDWEDPRSYNLELAIQSLQTLLAGGEARVPVFDISTDTIVSTRRVTVEGSVIVAEGVWGPAVVEAMRDQVHLHVLVIRSPARVAATRFQRDVHERNKTRWVAARRTARLLAREPRYRRSALGLGAVAANDYGARELVLSIG